MLMSFPKPVPTRVLFPRAQLNILPPAWQGGPIEQPQTSRNTLLTLTETSKSTSRQVSESAERGTRIFKTLPPRLTRVTEEVAEKVLGSLTKYAESLLPERRHFLAQYRPVDVAFKVVGTGSVGLRDYCVFMEGNGANDPLFLQIKEEVASGYAPLAT